MNLVQKLIASVESEAARVGELRWHRAEKAQKLIGRAYFVQ